VPCEPRRVKRNGKTLASREREKILRTLRVSADPHYANRCITGITHEAASLAEWTGGLGVTHSLPDLRAVPPFDRTRRTSKSQPRMQRDSRILRRRGNRFFLKKIPKLDSESSWRFNVINYSLKYYVTVKEKYTYSSFFCLAYAFHIFDVLIW